ncbi:MAG: cytochrome c [Polyangiaceae bacterium]|nr:cytochrome c [Polyangiaceae bacterium]
MSRFTRLAMVLGLSTPVATTSCDRKADEATPPATASNQQPRAEPPAPAAQAKTYFQQKCVVCHGPRGEGDGPGAAALDPKPAAFSNAQWQASVTDEHLARIIVDGGAAAGKSAAMPPNPDLKGKPELVSALVATVRSFKR